MNKKFVLPLVLAILCSTVAFGQHKKKAKEKAPESNFKQHLWYGGGLDLNFYQFTDNGTAGSVFDSTDAQKSADQWQ